MGTLLVLVDPGLKHLLGELVAYGSVRRRYRLEIEMAISGVLPPEPWDDGKPKDVLICFKSAAERRISGVPTGDLYDLVATSKSLTIPLAEGTLYIAADVIESVTVYSGEDNTAGGSAYKADPA